MDTDSKILKERALFYLGRKLGELDRPTPDHVKMAESGMSYGERSAALDNVENAQQTLAHEREAWKWVLDCVMEAEPK